MILQGKTLIYLLFTDHLPHIFHLHCPTCCVGTEMHSHLHQDGRHATARWTASLICADRPTAGSETRCCVKMKLFCRAKPSININYISFNITISRLAD